MGQHDKHLPERKHLNKTWGNKQVADPKTLKQLARNQGDGTKSDAKDARQRGGRRG